MPVRSPMGGDNLGEHHAIFSGLRLGDDEGDAMGHVERGEDEGDVRRQPRALRVRSNPSHALLL